MITIMTDRQVVLLADRIADVSRIHAHRVLKDTREISALLRVLDERNEEHWRDIMAKIEDVAANLDSETDAITGIVSALDSVREELAALKSQPSGPTAADLDGLMAKIDAHKQTIAAAIVKGTPADTGSGTATADTGSGDPAPQPAPGNQDPST